MSRGLTKSRHRSWLLAALSALLLVLSYPHPDWGWLAWAALVPLLVAVDGQSPRRAFLLGGLCGALFFLGLLHWIIYVTAIGWLLLCAYLGLFVGCFGWLVVRCFKSHISNLQSLVILPSTWVALEYARSHLLTGFGWGLLGYTQWRWSPIIQMADVVGAYGVSWLVALVNVALWLSWRQRRHQGNVSAVPVVIAVALLGAFGYGQWRLRAPMVGSSLRIAVVQGNIPQSQKWDPERKGPILGTYARLTRQAAAQRPDLIVWPETSVPDLVGVDPAVTLTLLALVRDIGVPCVVGAPTQGFHAGRLAAFNSALLVTPDGGFEERYNKLHLVPFGEFLPFERYVPWLRDLLPPMGDFAPGESPTVFRLGEAAFSTLVCFEDVFAPLVRRFARKGAGLLLVITNDAWFGPTAAAVQHAQASVFRAIENRVSVVRAGNTGLSCFIDPWGRHSGGLGLFEEGVLSREALVTSARSAYCAAGDAFALLCVLLAAGWLVLTGRLVLPAERQRR